MSVRDAITMRQDSHYIVSKIKLEPLDALGYLCLCAVHFSPYIYTIVSSLCWHKLMQYHFWKSYREPSLIGDVALSFLHSIPAQGTNDVRRGRHGGGSLCRTS